jgi:hypothetical protein
MEKNMAVLMRHKSNIYGLVNDLTKLTNDIATEVTRASTVEGSLSSLSTTDKTTLVAAINEVLALLQSQASSLADDLAAEVARATAAETQIASDLSAEIARATGAEGVLTTNLAAEVTRATTAEGVLTTNLAAEVTRATGAEGVISSELAGEIARATTAEGVLTTNLAAEVTRATAAEGVLTTGLATEVTNRIAGDIALDSRLDIIEAGLVSGVFWKQSFDTLEDLETALTDIEGTVESGWAYYVKSDNDGYVVVPENDGDYVPDSWFVKSLIKFADYTEVSGIVATERARALAAEGQLNIDLSSEITRATNAETAVQNSISAEVTRATTAESVLDGKIATEKSRAEAAEVVLQGNIDTEVTRAIAAEATLTADLAAEVTRATTAESVLDGKIATEKSRAEAAEVVLQGNIDTEVTRAIAAEATLTADLAAEVTRATTAESVLDGKIATEKSRAEAAEALKLAIASNLSDLANIATARTNIDVYSKAETNEGIRLGGAIFVTETVSVSSDKIVLTNEPKNGIVFNFATVRHVDANFVSYDIPVSVTATAGGKEFLLSADASGQFDGKSVIVQYAYVPTV